jgi:adenine-specific DNA glycosylase
LNAIGLSKAMPQQTRASVVASFFVEWSDTLPFTEVLQPSRGGGRGPI